MNDLICLATLLACCGATLGLVRLCEHLLPRTAPHQEDFR